MTDHGREARQAVALPLFDVHSPHCEVPTGQTGTVETRCEHGVIIRDASICGATKPCPIHGGEFPTEEDVPIEVRRELLKAASANGISYYWLCAIYRKGAAALVNERQQQEKGDRHIIERNILVGGYDARFWRDSYNLLREAVIEHLDDCIRDDDVAEEAILIDAVATAGKRLNERQQQEIPAAVKSILDQMRRQSVAPDVREGYTYSWRPEHWADELEAALKGSGHGPDEG